MSGYSRLRLGACLMGLGLPLAAQQPAAPPAFAPSNLSESGVRALASTCAACHGTEGRAAPGSAVPGLAGRPSADIRQALADFRDGKRPSTLMQQIAKGFTEAETAAIADYFARGFAVKGNP